VLATCIFGIEFDTLSGKLSEPLNAYNYCLERLFNPLRYIFTWINKLPLPVNKQISKNLAIFDKYCWEIMDQTKRNMEKNLDNPSNPSMIELMYQNSIDEETIRDNVSVFFVAGHETTAASLGWLVSILASHPEIQEKARAEVLEKVSDPFTHETLKELPYIDALIKETMRLYPPAAILGPRYALKESIVNGVKIPVGTTVQVEFISMGRDQEIWIDPEEVRPERWFPENITKEQRNAWMPFSSIPRICIAMNFSLQEQKLFLIYLLKRYKEIKLGGNCQLKSKIGSLTYCLDYDKFVIECH